MNKIYKVVWSKVKHCYVVTSELAKLQTKGCGTRSLRMATVSLGVAASLLCSGAVLPIFGESVAEAGQVTNVDDARVTADNAENSIVYGNNTGNIKEEKDDAVSLDGNTISINITKTLHRVYGGYSSVISAYTVSGNTVNIEKGMIQHDFGDVVVGGYSTNGGKITGNTVNVSGGSITGRVVGGCSMYGNVTGNAVNISGETTTINGDICGGDRAVGNQGSDVGSTTDNTVVISGGNVNGDVYGGTSSYFGGDITKNKVYIDGGTITGMVTGGKTLGQGNITNNEVHISNNAKITDSVYGGSIVLGTGDVKGKPWKEWET